jgi:hypothetical protein
MVSVVIKAAAALGWNRQTGKQGECRHIISASQGSVKEPIT